ncbi:heme utilization cystosolic carrier protein HutX [uncultured Desulfuromonas sp.]|uniref:heme utilization cystosolic carrier protein HutX n=1 Tax=uncultured Desulfuromonas sp. TaxID=181013 RepID=UPI002AAB6944|nr:heme utilization cystosolic carrier protein HutX [uncultured Desulfuromonas sp.]
MKCAVIYSSKTGNTKKVAEAILQEMPEGTELHDVASVPADGKFDLIAMGYWIDKGTADQQALTFMSSIDNTKIFSFFTLGAAPDSDHAEACRNNDKALYGENCEIIGTYCCQGAIDPKLTAWMEELPAEHPHAPNEERRKRWAEAAEHPNQADLEAARAAIRRALAQVEKTAAIRDRLKDPKTMPFAIAKELDVSDQDVYAAMPGDMAVAAPISHFKYIWDELSRWEKATFIAMTPGMVVEVSGPLPAGKEGHGFFNLHAPSCSLGGHILLNNLGAVYFVSRPFMGKESHSVQFFDTDGRHAFAVYVGRDESRQLLAESAASFMRMKTAFRDGTGHKKQAQA